MYYSDHMVRFNINISEKVEQNIVKVPEFRRGDIKMFVNAVNSNMGCYYRSVLLNLFIAMTPRPRRPVTRDPQSRKQ